jgi:hypothetical protein
MLHALAPPDVVKDDSLQSERKRNFYFFISKNNHHTFWEEEEKGCDVGHDWAQGQPPPGFLNVSGGCCLFK